MTAISVTFSPKVAVDWDPQKPLTTTKLNGLVDNTTHLREWLGASYYAGAVQDHNHDGSNSAAIPVGPNYLRNGSFESGLSGWTATPSASGTVALNTTAVYVYDGLQSLAITSTVLADGGGAAETNEYVPCSEGQGYGLIGDLLASIGGVSGKVEVEWYDITQALINASTAYTSNSIPTAYTKFGGFVTAPANARFMRVLCTGGIPATGTAVGTVYFDGLVSFALPQFPSGTTGVTQAIGDNSTKLSTTAYADTHVKNDVGNVGVGTMIYAAGAAAAGSTIAGSSLHPLAVLPTSTSPVAPPPGTWRNIGAYTSSYTNSTTFLATVFQRIS